MSCAANTTEGAINDLESVPCGPLDAASSRLLIGMLLRGIDADFDERTVEAMVERSGGIPYLMHHLANTLRNMGSPCTPASVAAAWETFVHDRDQSRGVIHFLTRISRYYADDAALADRLLDMTAIAPEPLPFDSLVEAFPPDAQGDIPRARVLQVVDNLVDDHYLRDTAAGVEWRYPVVRRIWRVRRKL